ncbi:MAG: Lrp/AsnC ligand binding domain-containing protein, partial [Candidatus Bathyarchaeota archaeon]
TVLAELEKMDALEEAYMVYGTFDIVAKIKTDTMDKIKDTIIQVRLLGKVRSTQTMVVMGDT